MFICHYNRDFDEWTTAHRSREAALQDIREAFQVPVDPTTDEAALWTEARKAYQSRNCKGFTFNAVDPATMKVTNLL